MSPSTKSRLCTALAAGVGALLPFTPDLVRLIPGLPEVAASALCAAILAVAYQVVPAKTPKADA